MDASSPIDDAEAVNIEFENEISDKKAAPAAIKVRGKDSTAKLISQFIARAERIEGDIAAARDGLKEIFAEVKSLAFDTKIMRQVMRERKKQESEREEQMTLFELYWDAVSDLPRA